MEGLIQQKRAELKELEERLLAEKRQLALDGARASVGLSGFPEHVKEFMAKITKVEIMSQREYEKWKTSCTELFSVSFDRYRIVLEISKDDSDSIEHVLFLKDEHRSRLQLRTDYDDWYHEVDRAMISSALGVTSQAEYCAFYGILYHLLSKYNDKCNDISCNVLSKHFWTALIEE